MFFIHFSGRPLWEISTKALGETAAAALGSRFPEEGLAS